MNHLLENIPIISGVAVAVLSFLSSLIKFLSERSAGARGVKRLKDYTDIYTALPSNLGAKANIAKLVEQETAQLLKRTNKRLNVVNIIALVVVAVVGGGMSYILAFWAINTHLAVFAIIAWLLFAVVALFTLGLSIVGLTSVYEEPKNKANK